MDDPYVRLRQARSILCLPLINQGRLNGVLYLENNLTPRVFLPARITVLKLLASQAAIAVENSRLYRDLAEREAKIRRLVDANIIVIFIQSVPEEMDGPIVEANDAFLRMVGYDLEDLASGRMNWAELTPPEWRDRDVRAQGLVDLMGNRGDELAHRRQPRDAGEFRLGVSQRLLLFDQRQIEERSGALLKDVAIR